VEDLARAAADRVDEDIDPAEALDGGRDQPLAISLVGHVGLDRDAVRSGGSHALEGFINNVARDIDDPETKESVWKRMQARALVSVAPGPRAEVRSRADVRIGALGSGSDYSPFLQHAGIPSLNLSFAGLDESDGIYHSIYDDYYHFTKFLDTDFAYGRALAQTVGTGIISPDIVDGQVIFGALMGAIVWNLLTWWGAIPSSSSHALIGGLIGAGAAKAGFSAVVWWGTLKTVAAIVWSPLLGFALALLLWLVVAWLLMRSTPFAVDQKFRVLQLGSAALYSIGHGANDAQKTMGIIASLLFAKGLLGSDFYVPFWVVLSCQVAMALGTLVGGWRIVKTMGSRITRLKPVQGFCAETAGAMTLYLATSFGVPVSTTHTITGAIMGVGAARRVSAVRWGIAGSIIIAWVITLPAAAVISALFYECVTLFAAAA